MFADPDFDEDILVTGLTIPTAVAWTPDGRTLIAEKAGVLKVVPAGASTGTQVLDLQTRVFDNGDRGLLGVAVDPNFATNGYAYLLYTRDLNELMQDASGPAASQLMRIKLNASNQVVEQTVILGTYTETNPTEVCPAPANDIDCIPSESYTHSIGTVRAAPDGTLYVGTGDGVDDTGAFPEALNTYNEQSMRGKIFRVDRDGKGLAGNPFCPSESDLTKVCTKVHAKGFRNPFRFGLRSNGDLIVGDVGQSTWEELNLVNAAGKSYGWPCYEGAHPQEGYAREIPACQDEYADPGRQTPPDLEYSHTVSPGVDESRAILGGPEYTASEYPAGYPGSLFIGDYGGAFLKRVTLNPPTLYDFATSWYGLSLDTAPDGNLVYLSYGNFAPGQGALVKIVYSPQARPNAVASANPTSATAPPLVVSFDSTGSSDPDTPDENLTYHWDFDDNGAQSNDPNPQHTYAAKGRYEATLTVTDDRGKSDTDTVVIQVGNPPGVTIDPNPDRYVGGALLTVNGSATDAEDGTLPATSFRWNLLLNHGGAHVHPVSGIPQGQASVSTTADTAHDSDSHYEATLTATDSDGLETTTTINIAPQTVRLRLLSSPSGVPLSYGLRGVTTPFEPVTGSAVGFKPVISAPAEHTAGGRRYEFESWSDGGARSRTYTIPDTDTTLTATYRDVTPAPPAATPPPPRAPADKSGPKLSFNPRRGLSRKGVLRGTASDPAGLRSFQVGFGKKAGGGCRWWIPRRRGLSARHAKCDKPSWIRATLTRRRDGSYSWSAKLRRAPAPGRYLVVFRAVDKLGNKTRRVSAKSAARVIVKRARP